MRALGLTLVLVLTGCGGDKETDTDVTDTDTDGPTGPSFVPIYQEVMKPTCALAGCHAAPSVNGMELSDATAYDALIDMPAQDAPGEIYVIPGDADGSYIVKKMEGAAGIVGDPMPSPFGLAGCCPEDVERIREWIDAGALP